MLGEMSAVKCCRIQDGVELLFVRKFDGTSRELFEGRMYSELIGLRSQSNGNSFYINLLQKETIPHRRRFHWIQVEWYRTPADGRSWRIIGIKVTVCWEHEWRHRERM
jgi:hypothetical protein